MNRIRLLLIALVVVGIGTIVYLHVKAEAATPQVVTAAVTRGTISSTVNATGTLQPVDTVEVGTQVTGTIQTLRADFNSPVKKGEVIATLDPAVLQSQVEQAAATVNRLRAEADRARVEVTDAEQKLKRAQALSERQLLPRTELETAQVTYEAARASVKAADAQLGQAQAALNQSQVNLSHTVIRTPVDGVVLSRNVEVGQTVAAGLQAPTLFVIARDLGTMQLSASVDEADIGRIQPGQIARFTVDAYDDEIFTGKLSQVRLQPTVAQNVVSYTAIIDVPNPMHRLKPGMTATVGIETARADDVVRIPAAALRFRPTSELLAAVNGDEPSASRRGRRDAANDGNASEDAGEGPRSRRDSQGESAGAPHSSPQAGHADQSSAGNGSDATVWLFEGDHLRPVRVRAGLSDGTNVQLVSGPIEPGARVVTGVATAASASTTGGSPLLPSFPRRGAGGRGGR